MLTPDQLSSYNNNFNSAMNDYFNSGNYMLNYGSNTASDPSQRFLNDPGTQLALQNSANAIQNQYAARGLGASGALAAGLTNNMFNNYNSWLDKQNQNYTNYQNQLMGLANAGQQVNGSSLVGSNSQQLASLLNNNYMTGGTAIGSLYGQNANALANLFASQGTDLASLITNAGAARASNIFNANNLAYQLAGNQAASNAQTASSMYGGQGFANALGLFGGTGGGSNYGSPVGTYIGGQYAPHGAGGFF